MADLAEILIIDHLTSRRFGEMISDGVEIGDFTNFHSFLKDCHMEIEEKVLFPSLKRGNWGDERWFFHKIDQLISDHRLIDTLGQNIIKWHKDGDMDIVREHIPLYFRILKDHNTSEESYIFSRWKLLPSEEVTATMKDTMKIIRNFGRKRYIGITELSDAAFHYMFGDHTTSPKHMIRV